MKGEHHPHDLLVRAVEGGHRVFQEQDMVFFLTDLGQEMNKSFLLIEGFPARNRDSFCFL